MTLRVFLLKHWLGVRCALSQKSFPIFQASLVVTRKATNKANTFEKKFSFFLPRNKSSISMRFSTRLWAEYWSACRHGNMLRRTTNNVRDMWLLSKEFSSEHTHTQTHRNRAKYATQQKKVQEYNPSRFKRHPSENKKARINEKWKQQLEKKEGKVRFHSPPFFGFSSY